MTSKHTSVRLSEAEQVMIERAAEIGGIYESVVETIEEERERGWID